MSSGNDSNMLKNVELLAKSCSNYVLLFEKLKKNHQFDFVILYDYGKYQMVIDGQNALDDALNHNGRKLILKLLLQRIDGDIAELNQDVETRKITKVREIDTSSLLLGLVQVEHKEGTISGKSYKLPSNASRYSEKLISVPKKYKIGKKLGEGTLGKVRIAEGNKGGTYAVKIIQKNGRNLPQEADVQYLKKLRHKRIVEYLYIIEPVNSNEIHILMEYMHTGSLKDYIEANAPLNNNLVKCYIKQVAEGLEFLHSNGIIHQDLKPANLLLRNTHEERLIKIADFGSSRFMQFKAKNGQQGTTPKYTDPEVATGKEVAGRRSDIWSFGVIIIEMITGRYPWTVDGKNPLLVPLILAEEPPTIEKTDETDEELVKLSESMLSPIRQRPYACDILKHSALDEPLKNLDDDSEEDLDYF